MAAISPLARLDDFLVEERCAKDDVAEAISLYLYGQHYDDIPPARQSRVEAFRALRAPQAVWMAEALKRAHLALDHAMAQEMGPVYRSQAPEARKAQAVIAVSVVVAAFLGTLELEHPFDGPGQALTVYEAADAAAREVR